MIVQMVFQMSGGRYDDRNWPVPWVNFEVPDEEGRGLIACHAAVEVPQNAPVPPAAPVVKRVTAPAPAPVAVVEDKPASTAVEPPQKSQPSPTDPKQAWVDYAVTMGVSRAEAEDKTKAQLQAAYGGRLLS